MNWHERLKAMLAFCSMSKRDLAKFSGLSYDSMRHMTRPGKELSRRFKDMIIAHEKTLQAIKKKL